MADTDVGTVGNGLGGASLRYFALAASSAGSVALRLPLRFSLSEATSGELASGVVSGLRIMIVVSADSRAEGVGPREEPGSLTGATVAGFVFLPAWASAATPTVFLFPAGGIYAGMTLDKADRINRAVVDEREFGERVSAQ